MTKYQWLLGFHMVAAFVFVSGAVAAGLLQLAAERRQHPGEIAFLLRLIRPAAAVVSAGALATLGFGIWLVEEFNFDWGDAWIVGALVLWVVSAGLAGFGGRRSRQARYLAEELAEQGEPSAELRRALADPLARVANYGSLAAAIAILGLMVWKPGA